VWFTKGDARLGEVVPPNRTAAGDEDVMLMGPHPTCPDNAHSPCRLHSYLGKTEATDLKGEFAFHT
jgi:hypothetical protein